MTITCTSARPRPLGVWSRMALRFRNWRKRKRVQDMNRLDDRMLEDIGVTRGELDIALGLPLRMDPLDHLYDMSRKRRQMKM